MMMILISGTVGIAGVANDLTISTGSIALTMHKLSFVVVAFVPRFIVVLTGLFSFVSSHHLEGPDDDGGTDRCLCVVVAWMAFLAPVIIYSLDELVGSINSGACRHGCFDVRMWHA